MANEAKIVKTVVGRAIHSNQGRQPIIPVVGTSLSGNYTAQVPATAIRNNLARKPNG
jgi:hypothetical protein